VNYFNLDVTYLTDIWLKYANNCAQLSQWRRTMKLAIIALTMGLLSVPVMADNSSTLDAAIGGGIGGAIGAAVGNEVAGKDGAMIGGAVGAAAGVAVNVDEDNGHRHNDGGRVYIDDGHHHGHFCPPGQAKKGNC
jgi:outer membrane lipoprotein SlyB